MARILAIIAAILWPGLALFPRAASAHPAATSAGQPFVPTTWASWTFDPLLLLTLSSLAGLYVLGLWTMWRRAGLGRAVAPWRVACFAGALATLIVALISPLDALSEELSSAHMVQHMLLMNLAAPLCVLGVPAVVMLWGMPAGVQRIVGQGRRLDVGRLERYWLWQPLLMWSMYAAVLWIWHLPILYQAALRHPLTHEVQHISFFVVSCLFWRVVLDPLGRWRLNRGLAILYLFTTSLHATVLGVFMALAAQPWYPDYDGHTVPWGLTMLEDQQLAGLIMWMPACLVYAVASAAIFVLWLRETEQLPRSE